MRLALKAFSDALAGLSKFFTASFALRGLPSLSD
jgi:hypothetical protein